MDSKVNGSIARDYGQTKHKIKGTAPRHQDEDYHQLLQAYADQCFDFLEPLRTDRNFKDLLERNHHLYSRTDSQVKQLKQALLLSDIKKVSEAAQSLFDSMGRIGDVRMMRICYRILMQSRTDNLDGAKQYIDILEAEYTRLQDEILGFHLH